MKLTTFAIAYVMTLLTLIAPAMAIETKGNVITLTDEERLVCNAGGGCEVIPAFALGAAFLKLQKEVSEKAYEAGANAGYAAGYAAGLKAAGKTI